VFGTIEIEGDDEVGEGGQREARCIRRERRHPPRHVARLGGGSKHCRNSGPRQQQLPPSQRQGTRPGRPRDQGAAMDGGARREATKCAWGTIFPRSAGSTLKCHIRSPFLNLRSRYRSRPRAEVRT
jgi:hypothetical protein